MKKDIGLKGVELFNAGFKIVPIKAGEKHPGTRNWTSIDASAADLNRWRKSSYYAGFGILGEFTPGIDIDVYDTEIVKKLYLWCKENIGESPVRLGNKPRVLLPCQPPLGKKLGSIKTSKYIDNKGNSHQIEIKATGTQWVAYGINPDIKKSYTWHYGTLQEYTSDFLPVLNGEKIKALFEYFYSIVPSAWQLKQKHKIQPIGQVTFSGEIINADAFENYKPPLDIEPDRIISMLTRLHPDKYIDGLGWRTVGMALYHQFSGSQEGFNIFEKWSQKSVDYDLDEIKTRWPSWEASSYSGNPITAATIVKMYKRVSENSDDPTLKRKSNDLSYWEKRFALVELPDGSEVHDMGAPIWRSPKRTLAAFKEHNSAYSQKITLSDGTKKFLPMVDAWRASLNTRHFAGYTYQPGNKRYCKKEFNYGDTAIYVNTFFFPPHDEIEVDEIELRTDIFFNFMTHLFPEKIERDWIIMWLARMIQNPGTRSFVTPLSITPVTGTGRGLFFEVMRRLIGGHNCHDVSRDDMEGRFNGYLDSCIVAVVQEIKAATGERKYQMWEKMKSLLADSTANIQSKGKDSYTASIRANFILFSNNINALPVEDAEERRIYAMRGASKPIAATDVDKLVSWMADNKNISALFCFLRSYVVNHDQFKRAPVTETKHQMVIASAGEGRADLMQWVKTEAPDVFDFDYALSKLEGYSQEIAERGLSRRALRRSITDLGWRSMRIHVDGSRVYVYYNPLNIKNNMKLIRAKYLEVTAEEKL